MQKKNEVFIFIFILVACFLVGWLGHKYYDIYYLQEKDCVSIAEKALDFHKKHVEEFESIDCSNINDHLDNINTYLELSKDFFLCEYYKLEREDINQSFGRLY